MGRVRSILPLDDDGIDRAFRLAGLTKKAVIIVLRHSELFLSLIRLFHLIHHKWAYTVTRSTTDTLFFIYRDALFYNLFPNIRSRQRSFSPCSIE